MARECRKCGEIIPTRMKVNGKLHHLQNRKFCIKCSPFKSGNTSPNDPIIRKARGWKGFTDEQKEISKISIYKRALTIRRELYIKHGGCCQKCGYSKCERALTFHHRDPSQKVFGLTLNNLWAKNAKDIHDESEKCDLLCMNCHAEVEDEIARKTSIVSKVNERYNTNF